MRGARRLQRAALVGLVAGVLLAGMALHRFWRHELSHLTGAAEWVWTSDVLGRVHPSAGLFVATHTLDAPPTSALLKVCGDREYVVYVNDAPAATGWSRPGFRLDLYDVGHLLRQGTNVIAVEVRSPTPVGALLLALDVADAGRNVLVSGPRFVARQRFSLAASEPDDLPLPVRWGRPPRFPWSYPVPTSYPHTLDEVVMEEPIRLEHGIALPGGGWEYRLPAPVLGYLWLEMDDDGIAHVQVVADDADVNLWVARSLAQPVVRIRGQRRWLQPDPQTIAAVLVFGPRRPAAVEIWPLAEELRPAAPGVAPGKYGPLQRTRWTTRIPPG